jgi:hypothetical protein
VRTASGGRVLTRQQQQKAKDEAKRKAVTDQIEKIYNDTKTRVETKLSGLDTEVGSMFDRGVDAALSAMTGFVEQRIFKYKLERYLSIPLVGLARWVADQFKGLPDEVNVFYEQGRALFQGQMDALIVRVSNLVEQRLKEAKAEVAKGQQQIKEFVASQPKELQQFAQQAATEVNSRFEELERGIDDKKNQLASALAQKYKEAFDKANEALKKIQDENKGLVAGFIEKLAEVIKMLAEFKDKLMAILRKGADTIKLILADPIGFLGNLIAAVKGGISAFVGNIWTHLKKGFMEWLFGALAGAGIQIPSDLTLPSILKLVLGVLGITYDRMRAKAVKLIGERNVKIIEKVVEYVRTLITGGPAALWEKVKEDLSNLKAMVIDAIQNWLVETVIKQAVTKIVSMFNPAGAIVQAVIAIYNMVMFVVEKATQIMSFVEAVVNSVNAIATGAIGGAISWIEASLAKAIPIVIGFLARLVGLGGISQKIKDFITKVQGKVDAAIDKAIAKIVAFIKKLFGGGKDKKDDKDKGPLSPEEVKREAGKQVKAQLAAPHDLKGVKQIVAGILQQLQPRGLKNLEVGPKSPEGFTIFATASPKDALTKLVPKKRAAVMSVTIKVKGAALQGMNQAWDKVAARDAAGNIIMVNGKPQMVATGTALLPPVSGGQLGGRTKYGGAIELPKPGSSEVKLKTWNTGELDPKTASNGSHAEMQFDNWLEGQDVKWRDRIESITATINLSPCKMCSVTLSHIHALAPKAVKTLSWSTPFLGGPNETTSGSLGGIKGWSVTPSSIDDSDTTLQAK